MGEAEGKKSEDKRQNHVGLRENHHHEDYLQEKKYLKISINKS